MSPSLTTALFDDFPDLYRSKDKSTQVSLMPFGFECSDGWEPLIRKLSEQLTFLAKVEGTDIEAVQVKEKFGTLSFYTNGGTDIMTACIQRTEHLSSQTCEVCGEYAKTRGGSWVRTLCAQHAYEDRYPLDDWEAARLGVTDHIRHKEAK